MNLLTMLLLNGLLYGTSVSAATKSASQAPYHRPENGALVPDEYMVILKAKHTLAAHFEHIGLNLSEILSDFTPMSNINAYSLHVSSSIIHDLVRYDPGVKLVEHNQYIDWHKFLETEIPANSTEPVDDSTVDRRWTEVKRDADWHMKMISAGKKVSGKFTKDPTASYSLQGAGAGVDVYILDTGIRVTHPDFEGRASHFGNRDSHNISPYCNEEMDDTNGHGTHCAGIVGRYFEGVASKSNLINVKVIGSGATTRRIARAVDDVTAAHKVKQRTKPAGWKGSVINLSLEAPTSFTLLDAVEAAQNAGIPIAVAAGNENTNANTVAPCEYMPFVVCVGAVTSKYRKADFSNYGPKVRILAPGQAIRSTWIGTAPDNFKTISGTSMASPIVAGVMAIFVGYEGIDNDFQAVFDRLTANAVVDIVEGFPTSRGNALPYNLLVNTGINSPRRGKNPYYIPPARKSKRAAVAEVEDSVAANDPNRVARAAVVQTSTKSIIIVTSTVSGTDIVTGGATLTITETPTVTEGSADPTASIDLEGGDDIIITASGSASQTSAATTTGKTTKSMATSTSKKTTTKSTATSTSKKTNSTSKTTATSKSKSTSKATTTNKAITKSKATTRSNTTATSKTTTKSMATTMSKASRRLTRRAPKDVPAA